ncbi:mitochondrial fission 1 protein [Cynoglossus semilaevis]|uniref:Mitochondrial fission 1 protein n=1 Tax=Cynoglossus semilaevis TaxID=244447 RepID=A0A3P8UX32_CYNSE|nr:mitochondrial fission 1 protein [Cynoglossus semilaevis]
MITLKTAASWLKKWAGTTTVSGNMEAVVSDVVAPEDLLKFEKKYNSELAKGAVSKDTKFEYAWCLIRSKYTEDIKKGIVLLEELVQKTSKDDSRDFLFYLAVANYRLKEYEKALKYVRTLLKNEPGNKQALDLQKLIEKALKKDGLVGMAIVGGIGLGVAGLAGLIGLAVSKGAAKS